MRLLVVNAGSSSLKLSVLEGGAVLEATTIEAPAGQPHEDELGRLVSQYGPFDAVGHRVVHGGPDFRGPVRVDDAVVRRLESLVPLAPLHQPSSLAGLAIMRRLLPDVPSIACFDTAFHATIPDEAATYALPAAWRRRWPLRRYGFHGLAHAYANRRALEMTPGRGGRVVTCHLGSGASLAAALNGRCVDTTMGFTPLEGLVMATRSGSVDPGLVLWLVQEGGLTPSEVSSQLEHGSGLAGLAGAADMRQVLVAESAGEPDSILAINVYLHRLAGLIASMVASLGGLDILVFTGGVGEHAAPVRARACERVAFLGVNLDEQANAGAVPDCDLTASTEGPRVLVVTAREDLEIARGVNEVLAAL